MNSRFTEKAQNALNRALAFARELGHTYIGSEHLLLGLINESDSVAAELLIKHGADAEKIKEALISLTGTGQATRVSPADMTPRTRKIIEASSYEALKSGGSFIGTEHILMALTGERDSVAVKLLETLGVSVTDLRADITAFLSSSSDSEPIKKSGKSTDKTKPGGKGIAGAPTLSSH